MLIQLHIFVFDSVPDGWLKSSSCTRNSEEPFEGSITHPVIQSSFLIKDTQQFIWGEKIPHKILPGIAAQTNFTGKVTFKYFPYYSLTFLALFLFFLVLNHTQPFG